MYVDYGTTCRVQKSKLLFLHLDFSQFPIQAIKASLANVVPVGGGKTWPREAVDCLYKLAMRNPLIAIISAVDHEVRKYLIRYVIVKY
jgi:hypothetical protein